MNLLWLLIVVDLVGIATGALLAWRIAFRRGFDWGWRLGRNAMKGELKT